MRKREKRLMRKGIEALAQYSSVMVFLLAISWILIITNPPSEFLRYDDNENMVVPKYLSVTEIRENPISTLIFLGLFFLLSFNIGLSTSSIYEMERKQIREVYETISFFSVLILASLLYPYYGDLLTVSAFPIGISAYSLGLFSSSQRYREKASTIWKVELALMILASIMVVAYLVVEILPEWAVIGLLVLAYFPLMVLILGLALGSLMNSLLKLRRRKRRKKSFLSKEYN